MFGRPCPTLLRRGFARRLGLRVLRLVGILCLLLQALLLAPSGAWARADAVAATAAAASACPARPDPDTPCCEHPQGQQGPQDGGAVCRLQCAQAALGSALPATVPAWTPPPLRHVHGASRTVPPGVGAAAPETPPPIA